MERVAANVHAGDGLCDFGHVTCNTFTTRASDFVMGVGFQRRRVWPIGGIGTVTIQTKNVGWLTQISLVGRSVNVMA